MSGLLANALPLLDRSDQRINRMDLLPDEFVVSDVWAIAVPSLGGPWWPRSAGFVGDLGLDVGLLAAVLWGEYDQAGGSSSSYAFVGVTRDVYGSILGGCTVKCFRTSDDLLISQVVSDAISGQFTAPTPYYPSTHYLVSYKAGSPDVQGTTPNTLIGA